MYLFGIDLSICLSPSAKQSARRWIVTKTQKLRRYSKQHTRTPMWLCSRCVRRSCVTSMSHIIHMNEACPSKEWVMSHIFVIRMCDMNELCHTYEWAMLHIWMSHVAHMNESCRTYEWVMSHIWMSHVAHMNESCRTGYPSTLRRT